MRSFASSLGRQEGELAGRKIADKQEVSVSVQVPTGSLIFEVNGSPANFLEYGAYKTEVAANQLTGDDSVKRKG